MRAWLKERREHMGKTQEEIAEAAGITRPAYTMIEAGSRNPSVSMTRKIGTVMNLDWTIFFEDQGNDTTQRETVN